MNAAFKPLKSAKAESAVTGRVPGRRNATGKGLGTPMPGPHDQG
jgi:hypothetical protein